MNQYRPGFELISPCSFPTAITTTPRDDDDDEEDVVDDDFLLPCVSAYMTNCFIRHFTHSWCRIDCCFHDLFKMARNILLSTLLRLFFKVHVALPYNIIFKTKAWKNFCAAWNFRDYMEI